ncbi:conserved hypothetical protein [Histoplasma capsulatum G186AR]|uniref:C3H1-type domain-containing protein n=2 Tax=Ajellomyces capsulatus TaxID=5037 RepID=C0NIY7_AJECG|nr:uncharacterized protein HCBG_03117 [Histoplasma capsulatum G186AR]EEH07828.1 conserved hypothetical protein [Histoplasma capsulatum G186AR]KAG5299841.1 spindle poison sensitivity protein Scp3 [Histoplasma capsulatum]QSS67532.1 spindle poison sensitivity protein Scp3 [Histoplasma capsulatum G186AR]
MTNDLRNHAPLPAPSGSTAHMQNGHVRNMSGLPPFDMARSPPNPTSKNTKHVPCKFFRQGACQAGPACPFLHSTDSTIDSAPCKYFTKGNCKFGAKCALAHILPDGRRVNRPNLPMGMSGSHLNLGGRVNPPPYHTQDSALANSLLSQQRINGHPARFSYPYPGQEDIYDQTQQAPSPYDVGIPTIDAGLVSDTGSKYGSPIEEPRLPMSPIGRTALDAPLPASFDSQGISYMARHGPVAASLPSKFGLDLSSPPPQRAGPPPDVVRNLHDIAFGFDSRKPSNLGSSPPVFHDEGSAPRLMHSQRVTRTKILSASLPRPTALSDWDDSFTLEEDYLPTNLHDDVLTPQERMRRLSRTEQDNNSSTRDFSGLGIPGTGSSKVGSPLASSPSRFGAIFAKQRQRKEEEGHGLGHVGSPLRESSLNFQAASPSPNLRPIGSRPSSGDVSPFIASPSRQSSMSMISQQLSSTSLHPSSARHASSVGVGGSGLGSGSGRLDRTISSPISTSRIDEEQSDLVFSMEEEENNKRNSVIWNTNTNNDNHNTNTNTNTSVTSGNNVASINNNRPSTSKTTDSASTATNERRGQSQRQQQEHAVATATIQSQLESSGTKGKTLLKEMESLYGGGRA